MRRRLFIILIAVSLFSCKDDFNDKEKRNQNWVWWIDAKTGKASWVKVNSDGPRVTNGKYTRFYFNGNVYEKGKLVNGENIDTIFDFDINGHPQEYRMLSNDTDEYGQKINRSEYFYTNGPKKIYYSTGSIEDTGVVENHQMGSKWTLFFEKGGCKSIRTIENGTGWVLFYYDNGRIKDSSYVDRDSTYLIRHYYLSGQLAKSIDFKNHNYNGLQREYYLNGQPKFICPIVNGELNGRGKRWYEDGHLLESSYRKDQKLNGGPDIIFYESGKIKMIAFAKNDKFDGEAKKFDESGKLILDKIFQDGVVVRDKLLDPIK